MSGTQRRPAAARQARPAQRYFPGKALPGAASVHSDSEDSDGDDEAQQQASQEPDVSLIGDIGAGDIGEGGDEAERNDSGTRSHAAPARGMNVALRNVNIQDGKVLVDGRVEVGRTEMEGMIPLVILMPVCMISSDSFDYVVYDLSHNRILRRGGRG
jgi:microfibrillar-associated protein 1